ncbi:MAG: Rne/Rng family ribonuclease [Cyanobacteriota bacterium ELA615]
MPKQIIIAEQHHLAAVFWEEQIQELVVATGNQQVGDIYLGVVENVIPGIDAAFVNIGDAERNGFIHVTDLGPVRLKKTAGAITELLAPQQKVLVQVMKEPTGNKGPRLTGNISLPGRYLVLMPHSKGVNLSRRIRSDDERSRLRALAILIKPAGMGLLVRTEAEGTDEESIMEDLEFLQKQWENIQQQSTTARAPSLLNRDDDFIQRVLRDIYSDEVNRIVLDSPSGVKRVKQQLMSWNGGRLPDGVYIDFHRENQPLLDYFRINAAIREALKPRVDLPSGGYIIIEPTEALTVIDVNSGSFTRSATARETVLWTNSEAATEIARQLRLRNIGGVIIVDFIDMDSRKDQLKLLEHFNRALKSDKARPQIAQLSELGLVELTRKRQGKNTYELFSQPCPHCAGIGHLAHLPGEHDSIRLESPTFSASTPPRIIDRVPQAEPELFFDRPQIEVLTESSLPVNDFEPVYESETNPSNARHRRRRRRNEPETNGQVIKADLIKEKEIESPEKAEVAVLEVKERPQRLKPKEELPQEHISVEMTPLQQEVYARMGISPLILLRPEVIKDPQTVKVSVVLPGQEPTILEQLLDLSTTIAEPVDNVNLTEEQEPLVVSLPEQEEEQQQPNDEKLTRRRRQRSSAKGE